MLRDLSLLPVYDSAECHIVDDLIVPLLLNTKTYLRGVGFFTSSWLRMVSHGLVQLVERGGHATIVVSPTLEAADWEAMLHGTRARHEEVLRNALDISISELLSTLEADTLNALAWMVAEDYLEFRFAIARDSQTTADYHDKVAVFEDEDGDMVAIHGSFNDTAKAALNGEAFSVFKSWNDGQRPFVQSHHSRLTSLAENRNLQFAVFQIPDAARMRLVNLRTTPSPPYRQSLRESTTSNLTRLSPVLRDYQQKALHAWLAAGSRGVFEMATGTGKTITALHCAQEKCDECGCLAIVVLVPYRHLVEQWREAAQRFNFTTATCSSDAPDWPVTVRQKRQALAVQAIRRLCIISTYDTASSPRFLNEVSRLPPEQTMIIGDEVHNLGTASRIAGLPQTPYFRLGLSATPQRWMDEQGTKRITDYFGPVCFTYTLEEAIGRFLVPYRYEPVCINLEAQELEEYTELTAKIRTLMLGRWDWDEERSAALERLLERRALVVKAAHGKIPALMCILSKMIEEARTTDDVRHILVYCAPGHHRDVLSKLNAATGLRCHEFVHTTSVRERSLLLDHFATGAIQVLVAVKCLDEGVDVPPTRTAFLLASTSNPIEFVQRRGRILRQSTGKTEALVYDFLVVPPSERAIVPDETGASLLRRELPRFAEFARGSVNEYQARQCIWEYAVEYGLVDLLRLSPWDLYEELRAKNCADLS